MLCWNCEYGLNNTCDYEWDTCIFNENEYNDDSCITCKYFPFCEYSQDDCPLVIS